VSVHVIPRPHANVDLNLPLGRNEKATKSSIRKKSGPAPTV
jgi:microcompartment protein CcmL/EutN